MSRPTAVSSEPTRDVLPRSGLVQCMLSGAPDNMHAFLKFRAIKDAFPPLVLTLRVRRKEVVHRGWVQRELECCPRPDADRGPLCEFFEDVCIQSATRARNLGNLLGKSTRVREGGAMVTLKGLHLNLEDIKLFATLSVWVAI